MLTAVGEGDHIIAVVVASILVATVVFMLAVEALIIAGAVVVDPIKVGNDNPIC